MQIQECTGNLRLDQLPNCGKIWQKKEYNCTVVETGEEHQQGKYLNVPL